MGSLFAPTQAHMHPLVICPARAVWRAGPRPQPLASHGEMAFVLSRNVSGMRVNMCERPPAELPTRPVDVATGSLARRMR
jgi:hypothetical protein